MVNQRNKGARGERDCAKAWAAIGMNARRGQQFSGAEGKDVIGPKGIHIECKWVERFGGRELRLAIEQSLRDSFTDETAVVCHKISREPWLLTLRLEDVPAFAEAIVAAMNKDKEQVERYYVRRPHSGSNAVYWAIVDGRNQEIVATVSKRDAQRVCDQMNKGE